MERFLYKLTEFRDQFKPEYIKQLEAEANRHVSGITFGAKREYLLDARDQGLLLYHHGPEVRVIPGLPVAREELTGNEYVFIEYHQDGVAYHLVGSVDVDKQFVFQKLEKYNSKGYSKISLRKHQHIIEQVTKTLQQINAQ